MAKNVISAGGSGNCTSVWLVVWGQNTVHGIFPKANKAGLVHENLGLGDAFDSNNNRYRAYMDRWQWKCGLHVKDWRYVVRIANISLTDLLGQSGTQANTAATWLPKLMVRRWRASRSAAWAGRCSTPAVPSADAGRGRAGQVAGCPVDPVGIPAVRPDRGGFHPVRTADCAGRPGSHRGSDPETETALT